MVFTVKLQKLFKSRTARYGIPFVCLVVGGSFGLKEFATLRYQYSNKQMIDPKEFEKKGIEVKKPGEVTLESEYQKIKEMDIDNWEQVRGPRPWEEETMKKNIERLKNKST